MTFFEFIVPVIALAVAGVGILFLRWSARRLDGEIARVEAERSHPAE